MSVLPVVVLLLILSAFAPFGVIATLPVLLELPTVKLEKADTVFPELILRIEVLLFTFFSSTQLCTESVGAVNVTVPLSGPIIAVGLLPLD